MYPKLCSNWYVCVLQIKLVMLTMEDVIRSVQRTLSVAFPVTAEVVSDYYRME